MRVWAFKIVVAISVAVHIFDCKASEAFEYYIEGKSSHPVLYFAEREIDRGTESVEYVVILIHGLGGGTADCAAAMRSHLKNRYPALYDKTYIMSPCFPTTDEMGTIAGFKYAYWGSGAWASGNDSLVVAELSSYEVINSIMSRFADKRIYPNLRHVYLGGFSAGGQFVNRFISVGVFVERDDVEYRYGAGSPSSWLYFDNRRFQSDGSLAAFANETYKGYNNWHCGFDNRTRYAATISEETLIVNAQRRKKLYFCGTADNDPDGENVSHSNAALAQGAHRYERYLHYKAYAESNPLWFSNTDFIEIKGVGHSSNTCYGDNRILDYVMGHDIGWQGDIRPSVRFVSGTGDDAADGFSRESALRSLSIAIAQAEHGDRIIVMGGIYPAINTMAKIIRIEAESLKDRPVIDGGGTNRCVYVGSGDFPTNTVIKGFIIRNGYAENGAGGYGGLFDNCVFMNNVCTNSGGATCKSALFDCLVVSNKAVYGGGVYKGIATRTKIMYNISQLSGGGASRCFATDSILAFNRVTDGNAYGGGCYYCTNINCTVYGNYAGARGGGLYAGVATNCIVYANTSGNGYPNYRNVSSVAYCLSDSSQSGVRNIVANPLMNDPIRGDFRLTADSPCLNVGDNGVVQYDKDILGHRRVQDGIVDLGACEGVALATLTAEVEVPYSWIDAYPEILTSTGGDYEAAAHKTTGKFSASGEPIRVWQEYVAGTDPSNVESKFITKIKLKDGRPIISWEPALNGVDEKGNPIKEGIRIYKIQGSANLRTWHDVMDGQEANFDFFKVSVEMP